MMRTPLSIIALSLASVFLLSSCASRQTTARLDDVETYIQSRPDSALATLRAIDTATLTTRNLRAHYALLLATALDKNWIDTTDVNVVMPAVTYYGKRGTDDQQARAWYYLGRIQENDRDYSSASISFLKADYHLTDQSVQLPTAPKMAIVARIGMDSGRMIRKKVLRSPAPSILADSTSASGRPAI